MKLSFLKKLASRFSSRKGVRSNIVYKSKTNPYIVYRKGAHPYIVYGRNPNIVYKKNKKL